jgi:hypothetical protein
MIPKVTGYGMDSRVYISPLEEGLFFFVALSSPALEPIQPLYQTVARDIFPAIKQPEHKARHSPPLTLYAFVDRSLGSGTETEENLQKAET